MISTTRASADKPERCDRHDGISSEDDGFRFDNIAGSSRAIKTVLEKTKKVAHSDSSVLITGESGTGKELVAQAIHNNSPRCNGPMVVINCGAIPGELLESELFGHEKGSFTGAHKSRAGNFSLDSEGYITTPAGDQLQPEIAVPDEGDFIRLDRLENPPLVKRGEVVKLVASKGNLRIVSSGICKEDGSADTSVRVENLRSGRIVRGIVKGRSRIEVVY